MRGGASALASCHRRVCGRCLPEVAGQCVSAFSARFACTGAAFNTRRQLCRRKAPRHRRHHSCHRRVSATTHSSQTGLPRTPWDSCKSRGSPADSNAMAQFGLRQETIAKETTQLPEVPATAATTSCFPCMFPTCSHRSPYGQPPLRRSTWMQMTGTLGSGSHPHQYGK